MKVNKVLLVLLKVRIIFYLQDDFIGHGLSLWTSKNFFSGCGIVVGHKAPVDGLAHFGHAGVKLAVVGGKPKIQIKGIQVELQSWIENKTSFFLG